MTTVCLGEVAEIVSGATPKSNVDDFWGGEVLWATPADLSKLEGAYIGSTPRTLTKAGLASCAATVLPRGSVLLSSRAPIGHVAINTAPMATNQGFKSLVPRADLLDAKYLYHWLSCKTDYLQSLGNGATFKEVSKSTIARVEIPLPALDEQRRAASILDQADALRVKRRQVLAHLDGLAQSIFHDTFAMTGDEGEAPLAELTEVTSGITKGRWTSEVTSLVPYLAVSNVQDGHLKLDVVKEIDATAAEIDRYALRDGDLILTEGGDPDKLGRGTVWRSELPLCLHQNHIFRVRVFQGSAVLPDYLAAYLASRPARAYFLRSAKQTTGIASINMTQLKSLPVVVPRMNNQAAFVSRMAAVADRVASAQHGLAANEELFASLQSRALSGEL